MILLNWGAEILRIKMGYMKRFPVGENDLIQWSSPKFHLLKQKYPKGKKMRESLLQSWALYLLPTEWKRGIFFKCHLVQSACDAPWLGIWWLVSNWMEVSEGQFLQVLWDEVTQVRVFHENLNTQALEHPQGSRPEGCLNYSENTVGSSTQARGHRSPSCRGSPSLFH